MSEPNWNDYDDFLKEADKDDRVGDHDFLVTEVEQTSWPSGDAFKRVRGQLRTANNAKADFNLNPLPTPEELAAGKASWDKGKQKAIANGIRMNRDLGNYWGKTQDTLAAGDLLRVKCVKNKENYIRIIAILPKGGAKAPEAAAAEKVPF